MRINDVQTQKMSYLQAIRSAMGNEMHRDPNVFLMGEDVCANMYGSSGGMVEEFGSERIFDVPLSEAGFIGAAAGAAMVGLRPIVDVTFSPFLYPAMDQIVSIIAKSRYLYGGQTNVPLVIRSVMLYNINTGAQHSDRPYPAFMGIPGLKIIAPSDPYDMKGLLIAAIRDNDPVLCFEDVSLWSQNALVPTEDYVVPIGKAAIKREGSDVTIVAMAGAVPIALSAAEDLAVKGIDCEVIDLRTLKPLDWPTVLTSVAKTGRCVVVDPAHKTCSVASEISAGVMEGVFRKLKAPVMRVTCPDIPIPFSPSLERGLFPTKERVMRVVEDVIKFQ
jgi:acetoin:2,6-dichlorophenolindophenol oxidoreductase subunit beta